MQHNSDQRPLLRHLERRSLIITSNLVFSEWDRIFKNPMTTAAAIDRLGGLDLRSLPDLEHFYRESDDDDLEVGDHLLFEVMADDHLAWNLVTRRDAEESRALEVEDDEEDIGRRERQWLESL